VGSLPTPVFVGIIVAVGVVSIAAVALGLYLHNTANLRVLDPSGVDTSSMEAGKITSADASTSPSAPQNPAYKDGGTNGSDNVSDLPIAVVVADHTI
jgi:hypothetical protein